MEEKGYKVAFNNGKIHALKNNINDAFTLGFQVDSLYQAIIKRETTTPHTLEQNGVVERKNHMITEVVRAVLHDQRLPKFLWTYAANIAVYVLNQFPHQALGSKNPKEMFTSKKPNISHFRIFGSPVYFHVVKEKRNKLGASRKKGIFVGYSENTKGYRIYVAGQREVVITHEVTFDEDMVLSEVNNLPTVRSSQEANTREPKEEYDVIMPDVEEPMDPIDPPPPNPLSSKNRPSWLKGTLDDAEGHTAPRGTFHESKKPNSLKKAYRLKQAPRAWYERIDSYLMKLRFTRSEIDPTKFEDDQPFILVLYVDDLFLTSADPLIHKCSVVDHKSTSGCCLSLGSSSMSWMSRNQKLMSLSTAEAEYISASMAFYEAVWLRKLFSELFGFTLDTTMILCDNQSRICLSKIPIFHDRSKHNYIRYHYICNMVHRGAIRLQHMGTDEQVNDILTKPLGKVKFLTF
eukprot:PITA_35391